MGRRLLSNDHGICLAELLIALTAGVVVLAAAMQSLAQFERRLSVQQTTIGRHQDLRTGLAVLMDELRLADTGSSGTRLLTTQLQEVAFLANLEGASVSLAENAQPGQHELSVTGADDWPKGKRIVLCVENDCVENRLAREGRKNGLSLIEPLGRPFPAGSKVWPASYLRYYLGKDREGRPTVMRQQDGGTNPLIGEATLVRFRYFDREGQPTQEPGRAVRVRVELGVGGERRLFVREIGLRAV